MKENNNTVSELNNEEMAHVSGGDAEIDRGIHHNFTKEPHCRACGQKVDTFSGEYKCTTEGCRLKGKSQKIQDLDWY